MTAEPDDPADASEAALHEMQLGVEYVYRGFGELLACHHAVGRAMNRFRDAERLLREAGHEEFADELRDEHLPAGAVEDAWTYELVDEFRRGFLADLTAYEAAVREELADGEPHVTERRQQSAWRERAEDDDWRS